MSKVISEYKSVLVEAKEDKEKFRQWVADGVANSSLREQPQIVDTLVNKFVELKPRIKSPYNDFYYWIKNSTFDDFWNYLMGLMQEINHKDEIKQKEKDGVELIYSDDTWKVYHITNYEASAKYGKGTKWCITGTERWNDGKSGKETFLDYHEKNHVEFYFFIKNGIEKYALALYPDGDVFEIFNAEDVSIAYIPDAPKVKGLPNVSVADEKRMLINDIANGNIKDDELFDMIYSLANDGEYIVSITSNPNEIANIIENSIPDGYLEFEAVASGLLSKERYKEITGEDITDENIEDGWTGDFPYIEISDTFITKEDACNPNNYKDHKYWVVFEDPYYCYGGHLHSADDRVGLFSLLCQLFNFDNMYDFISALADTKLNSTNESLNEELDNASLSLLYHGSVEKISDELNKSINWITKDYDYAKTFTFNNGYIYTCKASLNNLFNVGKTDARVYDMLPVKPYKLSKEFKSIVGSLNIDENTLKKLLSDIIHEYNLDADGYKLTIRVVVRSDAFRKIVQDLGYNGIKAIEYDSINKKDVKTYGIFNSVKIISTEVVNESLNINENTAITFGDLDYAKKTDTRGIMMNGRGTGHFGTGFYFVSKDGPYGIDADNKIKYDYEPSRPVYEIDLDKYNLFKPKDNDTAYKIHDCMREINNCYEPSLNDWLNNNFDAEALEDELFQIGWDAESFKEDLDDDIDLDIDLDVEDSDDDSLSTKENKEYDNNYRKLIKDFIVKYGLENYVYADLDNDKLGVIESSVKEGIRNKESDINGVKYAINFLSKELNVESNTLLDIIKKAYTNNDEDTISTQIFKALGYEGVDVTHLNHDAQGLSGLDNFSYGTVIYDLKPNTFKRILEPRKSGNKHIKAGECLSEELINGKLVVYRVGQVDDFKQGLFFSDDLDYYDESDTGYCKEDAVAYELDLSNAKIFDPIKEWDLYVNTWSDIRQTEEFFKEHNFNTYEYLDGVDYDNPDEYHEVMTDTDYLSKYAYDNGYDVCILRDIPNDNGYGKYYTEYCVINKNLIKKLDKQELDEYFDSIDDSGEEHFGYATLKDCPVYMTDEVYRIKSMLEKQDLPYRILKLKDCYLIQDARGNKTHYDMYYKANSDGYVESQYWDDDAYMVFIPSGFKGELRWHTRLGEDNYYDCRVYDFGVLFVRDRDAYDNDLFTALGEPIREISYSSWDGEVTVNDGKSSKTLEIDNDLKGDPNNAITIDLDSVQGLFPKFLEISVQKNLNLTSDDFNSLSDDEKYKLIKLYIEKRYNAEPLDFVASVNGSTIVVKGIKWPSKNEESLNESKQDIERFRQWAGSKLADRFFAIKNRISDEDKDMRDIYWWMSKNANRCFGTDEQVLNALKDFVKDFETTPTKRERNKLAQNGSDKIYEDDKWLVLKIDTYEASAKYGKHTQWCITGTNSSDDEGSGGRHDFGIHLKNADIYFYINKLDDDKYALEFKDLHNWCLWDSEDFVECGEGRLHDKGLRTQGDGDWNAYDVDGKHKKFPDVEGLPDINKAYEDLAKKQGYNKPLVLEKIVKKGNKWQVQSEDGTKNLGTYNTKKEAEKRLQQVHYFKSLDESSQTIEVEKIIHEEGLATNYDSHESTYIMRDGYSVNLEPIGGFHKDLVEWLSEYYDLDISKYDEDAMSSSFINEFGWIRINKYNNNWFIQVPEEAENLTDTQYKSLERYMDNVHKFRVYAEPYDVTYDNTDLAIKRIKAYYNSGYLKESKQVHYFKHMNEGLKEIENTGIFISSSSYEIKTKILSKGIYKLIGFNFGDEETWIIGNAYDNTHGDMFDYAKEYGYINCFPKDCIYLTIIPNSSDASDGWEGYVDYSNWIQYEYENKKVVEIKNYNDVFGDFNKTNLFTALGEPIKITKQLDKEEESLQQVHYFKHMNEGREDFFKNSVVRDSQGNLLPVYHCSFSDFDVFSIDDEDGTVDTNDWHGQYGFAWFAEDLDYARNYGDDSFEYECYLNITKPLDIGEIDCEVLATEEDGTKIKDDYDESGFSYVSDEYLQLCELVKVNPEEMIKYFHKWWETGCIYDMTRRAFFKNLVVKLGYDGVTATEGGAKTWGCVRSNQIKLVSNENPTDSNSMKEDINKKFGYRHEFDEDHEIDLRNVIEFETAELYNVDILETILNNFDVDNKELVQEVIDNIEDIDEDKIQEAIDECIKAIHKKYPDAKYCLWLCDSEEDVYNSYIEPFEHSDEDIDYSKYQIEYDTPISDLGAEGSLYVYSNIPQPIDEALKESADEDFYYRGYDSRYGVFDSPSEYSKLYTWVTDSPEYALEYAENNEYGKVAKVRITCSDDEIGGVLDLPEDVDYYDPGDEEFQECILDQGLKGYGFESGDYDDYCICISKDCVEIIDPDIEVEVEEESLKESVIPLEDCPTDIIIGTVDFTQYVKNKINDIDLRVFYDTSKDWYLVAPAYNSIHDDIIEDAINAGYYDAKSYDAEFTGYDLTKLSDFASYIHKQGKPFVICTDIENPEDIYPYQYKLNIEGIIVYVLSYHDLRELDFINNNLIEVLKEDFINESKADQQKFIDKFGEQRWTLFNTLKARLVNKDIYYWLKKTEDELDDELRRVASQKTNKEVRNDAKAGAALLAEDENWKLYKIDTYEASKYYGYGTQWCISCAENACNIFDGIIADDEEDAIQQLKDSQPVVDIISIGCDREYKEGGGEYTIEAELEPNYYFDAYYADSDIFFFIAKPENKECFESEEWCKVAYVPPYFYSADDNDFRGGDTNLPQSLVNFYNQHKNLFLGLPESLIESKQDIEKFKQWAGDDIANRFFAVKDRLQGQEKDIYYWMGLEKKYGKHGAIQEILAMLRDMENTPTKKERNQLAQEGADLLYNAGGWKVYEISTYEASKKYGKGTNWCISGDNNGIDHFNDYSSDANIYFYIHGEDKYALILHSNDIYEIYDTYDDMVSYIPNAPKVQGLPDVSIFNPRVVNAVIKLYNIKPEDIKNIKNVLYDYELAEFFDDYNTDEAYCIETEEDSYYFYCNKRGKYVDVTDEFNEWVEEMMDESVNEDLQETDNEGNVLFERDLELGGKEDNYSIQNLIDYVDRVKSNKEGNKNEVTDSEGNLLSQEQIEFFKDSKARDKDGKLLVLYHGTSYKFDVFDKGQSRKSSGKSMSDYGFFFSTIDNAHTFAFQSTFDFVNFKATNRKPILKICYLNLKNPLIVNSHDRYAENELKYLQSAYDKGYDGLIYTYDGGGITYWVAFEPNQIKSIDNKNPTNSDNINESTDEDLNILDALDKEFGQEEPYMWSTYILPNGHFLNPDKSDYFDEENYPDYEHCDFEDWAYQQGYRNKELQDVYNNCLKMNVTWPYVAMPDKSKPTQEQLQSLREIIRNKDAFIQEGFWNDVFPVEKFKDMGPNVLAIYTPVGDELFDLDVSNEDDIIRAINQAYVRGGFFNESLNEHYTPTTEDFPFTLEDIEKAYPNLISNTYKSCGNAFIMPDGRFILSGKDFNIHSDFSQDVLLELVKSEDEDFDVLDEWDYDFGMILDAFTEYFKLVRVNDGSNKRYENRVYFVIPNNQASTQQWESLKQFLDVVSNANKDGRVSAYVGSKEAYQWWDIHTNPDDIVEDCKNAMRMGYFIEKLDESIKLVDEENENIYFTDSVYELKNWIDNHLLRSATEVVRFVYYPEKELYLFCDGFNGIHEMLEEMAIEQGLVDRSDIAERYLVYAYDTTDEEVIDYSDGIIYDYGDLRLFEVTKPLAKGKFTKSSLYNTLGNFKDKYKLINGQIRMYEELEESVNEKLDFDKEYDSTVKVELDNLNKWLDKYEFEVELVPFEDTEDWTDWSTQYGDEAVGMFLGEIQDSMDVFPIALNKRAILKSLKEDGFEDDSDELTYAIRGTLWHEAGHGIYNYLEDFYDMDDNVEEVVEEFARYREDSYLYEVLQDFINNPEKVESLKESNKNTEERVEKFLRDNFSSTKITNLPKAFLILKDGTLIECEFHPDLIDALCESDLFDEDEMELFDSEGGEYFTRYLNCVRATFDRDENYVSLPSNNLTNEQYERLVELLDADAFAYNRVMVTVDNHRMFDSNNFQIYDFTNTTVDDIIKNIKRFYSSGRLNEERLHKDSDSSTFGFDMIATESPYEVKDILMSKEYNEPMRVFIDENIGLYLVASADDTTHTKMVDLARENGYNTSIDDFDKKKVCIVFTKDDKYGFPYFDEESAREDDYTYEYPYDDYDYFYVYSRYQDFNKFELSKVLGKSRRHKL